MTEARKYAVNLKGTPLTLLGPELQVGDTAPDFNCVRGFAEHVTLESFSNSIKLFSVILSVDTPVCHVQTKRFNSEARNLPDYVNIITVSMDLPFALSRYCGAEGIDRVHAISDHIEGSFGRNYGILIRENRLLGRGVFIADADNKIRYVEYVAEIAQEPDYERAISAVKDLI